MKGKDLTGMRIRKLTVVVPTEERIHNAVVWRCHCDCGNGILMESFRSDVMYKTNNSGVRGVYYSKQRNKWIAQIMFKRKCYNLGGYDTLEAAVQVSKIAEEKLFGDFLEWYKQEQEKKVSDKKKEQTELFITITVMKSSFFGC